MLKMRLGSGWLGGPSPIFLFYGAESADLNEGSLRARHAKARLRARGHLKSFDTPGFWGGVSKIFMTLNGWDFRCVQQSAILHLFDLRNEIKISLHGIYKIINLATLWYASELILILCVVAVIGKGDFTQLASSISPQHWQVLNAYQLCM